MHTDMQNEALKEQVELKVSEEAAPPSAAQPPAVSPPPSGNHNKEKKERPAPPDEDLRNRMMLAILIVVFLGILPLTSNLNLFAMLTSKTFLASSGPDPRALYYSGLTELNNQNWNKAEKLFRDSLRASKAQDTPSIAATTENLARACYKQNKIDEATKLVDKQADLWQQYDPASGSWAAHGQIVKGNFRIQRGDLAGALDCFQQAYEMLMMSGENTTNMELNRSDLAASYQRILDIDPTDAANLQSRIDQLLGLNPRIMHYEHEHYVHWNALPPVITDSKSSKKR